MKPQPMMYIVDDEDAIRNSLDRETRLWRMEKGMELKTFPSAAQALQALENDSPLVRIIISDHRMNGMDGLEFLRITEDRYPHVATFLLTGYIDLEAVLDSRPVGVFALIEKPWAHGFLMERLEQAFAASGEPSPDFSQIATGGSKL